MSVNRRGRQKGMRRAYLKDTNKRSKYDTRPDEMLEASIGKKRGFHPGERDPSRNSISYKVWNGRTGNKEDRWTPNMTQPMAERTESWHHHVKEHRPLYQLVLLQTSTIKIRLFFDGFDSRTLYWFKEDNKLLGIVRESFTFSNKAMAMALYHKGEIPWK